MREIKLLLLGLRNFKGCVALDLSLDGRSVSVYGDNAAGKTTIFDGLTWLLFGKDSRGRGDFEIKPLDSSGKVLDHGAVTEVDATFLVDGVNVTLRKTFFERWSTKRGSADATYDGNTSEFYVDEVPVKKYEYERRVGELVSEELFRILTNVTWFCEGLPWQNRRKLLMEVCGVPDDREIMAGETRFADLLLAMGGLTLEDYKKKLAAQRKGLSGARNTIPARLDEQKKTVEALSAVDFSALEAERMDKAAHLEQLTGEVVKLRHGSMLDSKRNEVGRLHNQIQQLRNENQLHRTSQMVPVKDERPDMERKIEEARRCFVRASGLVTNEKDLIDRMDQEVNSCRNRWQQADQERFDEVSCPTCGQTLPAAAQAMARARFETEKDRRKREAVESANRAKETIAAATQRMEEYITESIAAENEVARLTDELAHYVPMEQPEIQDLPGFSERQAGLAAQISDLESEIRELESESDGIRAEISRKMSALKEELNRLDGELAKRSLLDFARRREEELRQEARKTAEELEALDKQLFLCDEFTRFKVSFIEDSINRKFRLARFRLFQEQVNGGLADCCEATYNGVPFRDLNNGMRINVGVDVIRTISQHYGLRVPLFVDNAESVVELADAGTQVIRLVVSGADKELRCEYGA